MQHERFYLSTKVYFSELQSNYGAAADSTALWIPNRWDSSSGYAMRKFAQRAVIVGAGMLTIMSAVDDADSAARAHADGPGCVVEAADQCPQLADAPRPDPARAPHLEIFCQPARIGAFCSRRWVH